MNFPCQVLDTACASRVLLKNVPICMTKADGFRVAGREAERESVVSGGKRNQETDEKCWRDALGSLVLSRLEDQRHCSSTLTPDGEPRLDLSLAVPYLWCFFPDYSAVDFISDSTIDKEATMTWIKTLFRIFENQNLKSDILKDHWIALLSKF